MKIYNASGLLLHKTRNVGAACVMLAIFAFVLIVGCSKKEAPRAAGVAVGRYQQSKVMSEALLVSDDSSGSGRAVFTTEAVAAAISPASKLVSTAHLRIRLSNIEAGDKPLADLLERYQAYSASTSVYENSRDYTLKVPAAAYKPFLDDLKKIGKIMFQSEQTEDVSIQYYDLESRLATQRELLKTFQSYLSKAKTIDEILAVEKNIAELQGDIDRAGSQFRALANRVDYATITLEFVGPVTDFSYGKPTFSDRIAELFGGFGDFVSMVITILLGIIVYGIPSIALLFLLYWLLLGKIGILKKLARLVSGKRQE